MLCNCLKCQKNTEGINPRVSKMIVSKCEICGNKKSRFGKKQEASGVLSNLCLKAPVGKIPLLGNILF